MYRNSRHNSLFPIAGRKNQLNWLIDVISITNIDCCKIFVFTLEEPDHTVAKKKDGHEQKRRVIKRQTLTVRKKWEQSVIHSVNQMAQDTVFAWSNIVLKSAVSTGKEFVKKCLYKVFIVVNIRHCQWFGVTKFPTSRSSFLASLKSFFSLISYLEQKHGYIGQGENKSARK